MQLVAEIEIQAPPERIWEILTDFGAYPQWNPFMPRLEGEARVGERLRTRLVVSGAPTLRPRLRVTRVEPGRELRWVGGGRLVHGERTMTLRPLGSGGVRFEQATDLSGPITPLLGWLRRYRRGLQAMNAALKARAEGGVEAVAAAVSPRKEHAVALFSGLGPGYDRMGALLSLGQEDGWRRAVVARTRAGPGDRVLDVATGTGLVAAELVRTHGCSVVGLDQSEQMLAVARERLAAAPELAGRIELVRGEAERLPFAEGTFDALTFTYLLRYVDDPARTLRELARVVRPGGTIAALEFGLPSWPWRAPWLAYTRVGLPALGALASADWYAVGRFLGPSIQAHYARHPLERLAALWQDAGIDGVRVLRITRGAGVVTWGTRGDGRP
jgi:demethylmenaquinone methyltransferase / 2-methoxy-6-polyprenyl-1,4-benzoquinol methylase